MSSASEVNQVQPEIEILTKAPDIQVEPTEPAKNLKNFKKGDYEMMMSPYADCADNHILCEGLSLSSIKRIWPINSPAYKGWLDDQAIDSYMKLINECAEDTLCLPVAFYRYFIEPGSESRLKPNGTFVIIKSLNHYLGQKQWTLNDFKSDGAVKFITIPVNKDSNHWILFGINLSDSTIYCFDSLRKDDIGLYNQEFYQIKAIFNKVIPKDWKFSVCKTNPNQVNNSDCGLAVCLSTFAIASAE